MSNRLFNVLRSATEQLRISGVDSPRLSAELLIAKALNTSRLDVLASPDRSLSPFERNRIGTLVRRRMQGEPLAYIAKCKEFYGLNFYVSPDVLIPRPETELIIEIVRGYLAFEDDFVYADICTGCGNLAVALAKMFPRAKAVASDLSSKALEIASRNISLHHLESRIQLIQGDLAVCFKPESIDIIVSNPPYLSTDEIESISVEVSGYEPIQALHGGESGFEKVSKLLDQSHKVLISGGLVLIEVGGQYLNLFKEIIWKQNRRWEKTDFHKDYQGNDRVLVARKV